MPTSPETPTSKSEFLFDGDIEKLKAYFPFALKQFGEPADNAWVVRLDNQPSLYADMQYSKDQKIWHDHHNKFGTDLSPTYIFLPAKHGGHMAVRLARMKPEDSKGYVSDRPINLEHYPVSKIREALEFTDGREITLRENEPDLISLLSFQPVIEDTQKGLNLGKASNFHDVQQDMNALLGMANFEYNPDKEKLLVPEKEQIDPASHGVLLDALHDFEDLWQKKAVVAGGALVFAVNALIAINIRSFYPMLGDYITTLFGVNILGMGLGGGFVLGEVPKIKAITNRYKQALLNKKNKS